MSPFLTVEQVAELLGASTRTVRERVRLGQLPHRKIPGFRRVVFVEAELRAFIDEPGPLETRELPGGGRVVRPVDGRGRA